MPENLSIRVSADASAARREFANLGKSLAAVQSGVAATNGGALGLTAAFSRVGVTGAALGLTLMGAVAGGLGMAGKAAVGAAAETEKYRLGLNNVIRDGALAAEMFEKLQRFADFSPFDDATTFQSAQKLLAMGIDAGNLIDVMTNLGDAAGGSAEKFSGLATAFGQVATKGRLQAEEAMQFAEREIPIFRILQEELGKTQQQLQDLMKGGNLSADVALPALQRGLARNFGGGMEAMSQSVPGLQSTLGAAFRRMFATLGIGFEAATKGSLSFLIAGFTRLNEMVGALTRSDVWAGFMRGLADAGEAAKPLILGFGQAGFGALVAALQLATPALHITAAALRGIGAGITTALRTLKPLIDGVRQMAQTFKSLDWQGLWQSIKADAGNLAPKINEALIGVMAAAWELFKTGVLPTLTNIAHTITSGLAGFIMEHPEAVLAGALAFQIGKALIAAAPLLKSKAGYAAIGAVLWAEVETAIESEGKARNDAIRHVAVGGIAAALVFAVTKNPWLAAGAASFANGVVDAIKDALTGHRSWEDIQNSLIGWLNGTAEEMGRNLQSWKDAAGTGIANIWQGIQDKWGELSGAVGGFMGEIGQWLVDRFTDGAQLWGAAWGALGDLYNAVAKWLGEHAGPLGGFMNAIGTHLRDAFTGAVAWGETVWQWLGGMLQALGGWLGEQAAPLAEWGAGVANAIASGIQSALGTLWAALPEWVRKALGGEAINVTFTQALTDSPYNPIASIGPAQGPTRPNQRERDEHWWKAYNYHKNIGSSQIEAEGAANTEVMDLFGFARGGSFKVGGTGGTDSQLVAFRASPDETVSITRPDQRGGGIHIENLNVQMPAGAGYDEGQRFGRGHS